MTTRKLKLKGLSCVACEQKIEKAVRKINGVVRVEVSYVKSAMDITFDEGKVSEELIQKIVEKAGYEVLKEERSIKETKQASSYMVVAGVVFLLLAAYVLVKNTIGFTYIPEVSQKMGFGILFVVGLATSLHCVAMCGGINLSQCMSYKTNENMRGKGAYQFAVPSVLYNGGRLLSYTVLGGVIGGLGSVISISETGKAIIAIVAGVFMLIMGLNMLQVLPAILRVVHISYPKSFLRFVNQSKKNKGPFIVGLLNGAMPCGPLQAMQVYALGTGSVVNGALSMFFFGLGTLPLMFFLGTISAFLNGNFSKKLKTASAILVIVLGVAMFNRGVALAGIVLPGSDTGGESTTSETRMADADTNNDATNETQGNQEQGNQTQGDQAQGSQVQDSQAGVDADVQVINSTLKAGSYPQITVKKGVPVKWTISANASTLNGCNGTMVIPEYDIQQKLKAGDTVITFTPTESGKFAYSCWMGMIRSSITVEE